MIWWFVLGCSVAALAFVLPPLLGGRGKSAPAGPADVARAETLRQLYLNRREELQREVLGGQLDAADLQAALTELDASFLAESDPLSATISAARAPDGGSLSGPRIGLALSMGVLTLAVPLLLYSFLGEPQAAQLASAEELFRLTEQDTAALRHWEALLSARLERHPADVKSQFLLGQVALKQRRYEAAAAAFAAAHRIHGQADPTIDLYWLQARFLAAQGQLDAQSREIADRLLAQNPESPAVYEILAIDAFARQDYMGAIAVLNRALGVPLDVAQRASFAAGLAKAREQIALGDAPVIDIQIKGLEQVPKDRTLFVIARPPGGGMPYAVVRRPGPDFPTEVRLDDAVSMNPAAPLSAAAAVEVIVRVSVSGQAAKGPNDWQWQSETLTFAGAQRHFQLLAELTPPG